MFKAFFSLSSGLSKAITAPKGTLALILNNVKHVEDVLGLHTEQCLENPPHWESTSPTKDINDDVYCETVESHNEFVMWLYDSLGKWSENPIPDGEPITPADAMKFWHGLQTLEVPPARWTTEYYRKRMEAIYEVMRGRDCDGMSFDEKPLTPKQAAAVIRLFEQYLDPGDLRLDVPKGEDHLASSYDGGYIYCDKCGPVTWEHMEACKKRKCPAREDYGGD